MDLYFPFTIRCHRGLTLSSVSDFKASGTDGFTSDHTAATLAGYSTPLPVQCLDGKGLEDYDVFASAADQSEDVGETGAVTTESDAAATRTPRQFAVAGAAALAAALA